MNLNQVLLPYVGEMRSVTIDGVSGGVRDGSALEFQANELLAFGAAKIAIRDNDLSRAFVDPLSKPLRDRITLVDPQGTALSKFRAFISPIAEELGVDVAHLPYAVPETSDDEQINNCFRALVFWLPDWLLGIQELLQIDVDVRRLKDSADLLRTRLRSARSRSHLSILSGILDSYSDVNVDSFQLKSTVERDNVELFNRFIQDETYRMLSEQCHRLGYPVHLRRAVELIARFVRDLLKKPLARQTANLSSRAVTTATQVPTPDSEALVLCQPLILG